MRPVKTIYSIVCNQDPKRPASWDGIRNASENGNVCSQLDLSTETVIGDEDCLYLNVYVPRSIYGTTRIPVMVWIHGGGYFYGSGSDGNHRPDYLLAKEVIVVSINYRLGAFVVLCHPFQQNLSLKVRNRLLMSGKGYFRLSL
ncbi:hypothetical protein DMN91_006894 [Ooceraea biroi]|uniref:Carboxylesterase type B domain-containing protein n=1 Tax=Ooceraea biroi TaxID=2015173 RepID=A0A3L8DIP3_OOCBI|nr:hypothetical protein DMN91_006894 [Ooceraea biroi]